MPELPEVETIAIGLKPLIIGKSIQGFHNDWPKHIALPGLTELNDRIHGRTIERVGRRGKYLVLNLDQGEHLIIHLKMSGQLSVANSDIPMDKHVHTVFILDDGNELRFRDVRKFGKVYLTRDPAEILGSLGPEPFSSDFTPDWLYEQLQKRRRLLKPLLLDQTFVAGIGNIYADEALHLAYLRPDRISNSLSIDETRLLHQEIMQVLTMGITRGGASIDAIYRKPDGSPGDMQSEFAVYGRAGEPCLRCDGVVQRIVLGGRGTHICNECQI